MPSGEVHFVVMHSPGPNWQPGIDPRDQVGMEHHVAHYAGLLADGRLEMGGPFLGQDQGGMMVAAAGTNLEELDEFARDDPAVLAGLLRYEIRSWYVPMRRD